MSAEAIAMKMNELLKESGAIARTASDVDAEESRVLATSLLQVADQMDRAGAEEAASHVDKALEHLSNDGVIPVHTGLSETFANMDADLLLKAAATTLIRLSDRFDKMDKEVVSDEIDKALRSLAG